MNKIIIGKISGFLALLTNYLYQLLFSLRLSKIYIAALILLFGAGAEAFAQPGSYVNIDPPGSVTTYIYGINTTGDVAGFYRDSTRQRGFKLNNNGFTIIDPPNSLNTSISGINTAGDVIGIYTFSASGSRGFKWSNGGFTIIEPPGSLSVNLNGINDAGDVVGRYSDSVGTIHGFKWSNGVFTIIDPPGSEYAIPYSINTAGDVVGASIDGTNFRGFKWNNGIFTYFNVPGSSSTSALRINAAGDVVGQYSRNNSTQRGFKWSNGVFTLLDPPSFVDTYISGINDAGDVSGYYTINTGRTRGFKWNNGVFTIIEMPGAVSTNAYGINTAGDIGGIWNDGSRWHGFRFTNNSPTIIATVQTNSSGRSFTVDGVTYNSPQTFNWQSGAAHTIGTNSPQTGSNGTQYVWSNWSDGGAISHTVSPTTNATYTANFDMACSVQGLTPITDPIAQQFENGNTLNTTNLAPTMQTAYTNFRNAVAANAGNLTLNSAYRPPAYQVHLRDVWDKWQLLKNNTLPQCQSLKTLVQGEVNRHGIGNLRTRPASATGYHTQGLALDVNFAATGLPVQTIVNLAAQSGLIRPLVAKDPVHFILGSQLIDGKLPTTEEDGEEFEQGSNSSQVNQTISISNVFVTIIKQIVNNNYVYFYKVRNNDSRPILAFEIGYNDSTNASQLSILPVGWNFDTGLSATSTTSPTNWNSNLITTEESEFHSIEWRTETPNQNIQPLQTMSGFSVVLPQDDINYKNSNLKVVFADGSVASAHLSRPTLFDFDGDGKSDISVFRPDNGAWYLNQSANGFTGSQFGVSTDKLVPADYDGDGKTDIAVYRNGTWYLSRSQSGFTGVAFGDGNDIPQPADFDGDGKAELAVFRPLNGTWYILNLATNQFTAYQFGASTDKPVASDYDGDGKADIAVFRPSNGVWYLNRSNAGFTSQQFGISTDLPSPADYDGDGKSDVAVFRSETWYLNRSTAGFTGVAFGAMTDKPVPNAFVP